MKIDNLTFINALIYILENGCDWRNLPVEYGYWNSIYMKFSRWVENGIIEKVFKELHCQNILSIKQNALIVDSMTIKVHPDTSIALRKVASNQWDALKCSQISLETKKPTDYQKITSWFFSF